MGNKDCIIARGSTAFLYCGLVDKVFEIVFRKRYEEEIEKAGKEKVNKNICQELISLKNKESYHKGLSSN